MAARKLSRIQQILKKTKRLGLTFGELKASIGKNHGGFDGLLSIGRSAEKLRLIIRCRSHDKTCWAMSLVLNGPEFSGRIDCIDWEGSFIDTNGVKGRGFHRHVWDARKMNCEHSKIALVGFAPQGEADFIRKGLQLLGVALSKKGESRAGIQLSIDP